MQQVLKLIFTLSILALITGCAGPVPRIDSPAGAMSQVRTITVIRSPEPQTYAVVNFGHPGIAFGLIGGIVAAADQHNKQERLTQAIKLQGAPKATHMLADNIAQRLAQRGFEVSVEDGPWEEADGKFKLDFEKITATTDTVLVIMPTIVGFIATGATSDYLPTITAIATLLGKDREKPIYRGFHAAGWQPKSDGWRYSSPSITFGNFEGLMRDPAATAAALNHAAAEVAATVAEDLQH